MIAPQLQAPVQQATPPQSALDGVLNEELGYSMAAEPTVADQMPFNNQTIFDPRTALVSLGGGGGGEGRIIPEVVEKLVGRSGEFASKVPAVNPFAAAAENPQQMGQPALPIEDAIKQMSQPPDLTQLQGRSETRNINLNFFPDAEVKQLIDMVNKAEGGFKDIPQRQTQTHEETLNKAQSAETLEKLLNKRVDDKWNPEELVGMYKIMEGQAVELRRVGKQIDNVVKGGGEPDGSLLTEFDSRMKVFRATQETAAGAASEAGRLLNSLQALKNSGTSTEYYRALANNIEMGGGKDAIIQRAKAFAENVTLEGANQIVKQSWSEKAWEGALKVRYNLMLSSVRTHAANMIGNTLTGIMETIPQKAAASAFNYGEYLFRKAIPGLTPMKTEERVQFFAELPTVTSGALTGAKEGIKLAAKIAIGRGYGDGKFMNELGVRYDPAHVPDSVIGKIATSPTRFLEAEDAFFKSTYMNIKLQELAFRRSRNAENVDEVYRSLIDNPTDDMLKEAREYAARLTFSGDPNVYGKLLGSLANWIASGTTQIPALKILVPFVKTPANVLGYAFQTTGIGHLLAMDETYDKLIKGTPAERADVAGRIGVAVGLYALLHEYWQQGKISGAGSANAGTRAAWEAAGWQENAVKIGDKWYSLNRTDPLGASLAIVAGGFDAFYNQTNENAFSTTVATILSIINIAKDRSYLAGLSDFINLMETGSMKTASALAAQQAASFALPNFLRDLREGVDPMRRELAFDVGAGAKGVETRFVKYIQNAVPGLSKYLPPAIDANGDYIYNGGTAFWRGIVPIRVTEDDKQDAVAAMYMFHRTPVTKPSHLIKMQGTNIQINTLALDDQKGWLYMEYQRDVGKARHELVQAFLDSPSWTQLAEANDYGVGSDTDQIIRNLVSTGLKMGQVNFIQKIRDAKEFQPNVAGKNIGEPIQIKTPYTDDDLMFLQITLRGGVWTEEDAKRIQALKDSGVYNTPKSLQVEGMPETQRKLINQSIGFK